MVSRARFMASGIRELPRQPADQHIADLRFRKRIQELGNLHGCVSVKLFRSNQVRPENSATPAKDGIRLIDSWAAPMSNVVA